MRILVVEDDIDNWIAMQTHLAERGHYAFWASKAAQAIRFLMREREPFDLVLVDVDLGEGEPSGLEVVRAMIVDEKLSTIPRILITGLPVESIRERERAGTLDVLQYVHPVILSKPLHVDMLDREMADAVAKGGRRRV